jgi:hypothetical protein
MPPGAKALLLLAAGSPTIVSFCGETSNYLIVLRFMLRALTEVFSMYRMSPKAAGSGCILFGMRVK